MNKSWKRKPNPDFKDARIEDLFVCHTCKDWYPWFLFTTGKLLVFKNEKTDITYAYMDDREDRGGRTWACNLCIDKILYNNKIINITDNSGKLLD